MLPVVSLMTWYTEGACNVHSITRSQASKVTEILTAVSTEAEVEMLGMFWQLYLITT